MLQSLSIHNFITISHIELDFKAGFTVLTGETGAGKSILINALGLVLGKRADTSQIRYGCERAEIAAQFSINTIPTAQTWLQENALEEENDVCLLRRIIETNGRSRSFINGHAATLQQLRTISEWLIDIHSQHAHQQLMQSRKQCELLDSWAGELELVQQVASSYHHWQDLHQQQSLQEQQSKQNEREHVLLSSQLQELTALSFSSEEWDQLQTEHSRLSYTASLLETTQSSLEALSENEAAILSQLNTVMTHLHKLVAIDKTLEPICNQLQSVHIQLKEIVYELKHYQQQLNIDPHKLQAIEARITAIHTIARKYRTTPKTLPEFQETTQQRLETLEKSTNRQALAEAEKLARTHYESLAAKLSQARRKAAYQLSKQVTESMQTLAMIGGRFNVAIIPVPEGNSHGMEQIEFQVASHEDLPLRPLSKVASGGELSRISLAIQVITSKASTISTLIFDEVDTGIGGHIAEIVGKLLHQLGVTRQVISITHLSQVAAKGDHHWRVSKITQAQDKQLPESYIVELDETGRIEEIIRMLGGKNITAAIHQHAREMLGYRNSTNS
jgi:DNA repair protein RecN (Recombination protein N)